MEKAQKQIITVTEVAQMLHITPFRVRQKAACGELPGKKIPGGRDWLFNKSDIEKILP